MNKNFIKRGVVVLCVTRLNFIFLRVSSVLTLENNFHYYAIAFAQLKLCLATKSFMIFFQLFELNYSYLRIQKLTKSKLLIIY